MSSIHKLLNFSLPIITLILIPILMVPYLFVKLLLSVKKVVCSENLARKVVIITGAASGIGEQLAYEYARRGALLSLVDIRKDNLGAVANKARSLGSPNVIILGADVSKVQDCKQFVDETLNHFGRLDHLVNNAGICKSEAVENVDDVSLVTPIMDVNFWGAVYGTLFAIPHLKSSKGKIVVVASAGGWFPVPRFSIYNASKAAAINFFETLRIELGWAIGITIVNPGGIETPLSDTLIKQGDKEAFIPLETAAECAKAIVESVCKGDMYVTEPSWVKVLYSWKLFFPEVMDFVNRFAFRCMPDKLINLPSSQNLELKEH
ncbi:hypothetical protein L6164_013585 [Bauhinia variegata]|uniref:Uncharacterized protein n=1 Tax=Bauhinia variegata TaxID=167791 RepID=A0ACB9NGP0_BAUVA|nr:hypothetical protein L6164_013585 [Bauhinia variegata]